MTDMTVDDQVEVVRLDLCLKRQVELHRDPESLARAVLHECLRPNERFFGQLSRDNGCTIEQWATRLASEAIARPELYARCTNLFTEADQSALLQGIANAKRITGRRVPLRVHVFAGLFECSAVAYDSDIGFALETFLPQGVLGEYGLPESSVALSQVGLDDIPILAAHEYGHAAHVDCDDSLAAKVIAEGIAVVTSLEAVPGSDLSRYLLMRESDIGWCSAHEPQLIAQFAADMERTDWSAKRAYFGTAAEAPVSGVPARVGYYLGMRVCQDFLRSTSSAVAELVREASTRAILAGSGLI